MKTVDINCDLGESYGIYRMPWDEAVLPLITSANIACGFHAGDPATMRSTVEKAMEHQIAWSTSGIAGYAGFWQEKHGYNPAGSL